MDVKIYGLVDPVTRQIKYIGQTHMSLKQRLSGHVHGARSGRIKTPVAKWILSVIALGYRPEIFLLEIAHENWKESEKRWISNVSDILNVGLGGEGGGTHSKFPEEFRHLLGTISDTALAPIVGLTRSDVSYHRRNLGIRSCPQDKSHAGDHRIGKPAINRKVPLEEIRPRLGTIPDVTLAREFNVAESCVQGWRTRLGIQSFCSNEITRTGKYPSKTGEQHPCSILTQQQVLEIRAAYGSKASRRGSPTLKELGDRFGVTRATIFDVVRGRSWKCC